MAQAFLCLLVTRWFTTNLINSLARKVSKGLQNHRHYWCLGEICFPVNWWPASSSNWPQFREKSQDCTIGLYYFNISSREQWVAEVTSLENHAGKHHYKNLHVFLRNVYSMSWYWMQDCSALYWEWLIVLMTPPTLWLHYITIEKWLRPSWIE